MHRRLGVAAGVELCDDHYTALPLLFLALPPVLGPSLSPSLCRALPLLLGHASIFVHHLTACRRRTSATLDQSLRFAVSMRAAELPRLRCSTIRPGSVALPRSNADH